MDVEEIEGIGFLPRDLIIDILSRLPVKVLHRFKFVSKRWRSLISFDPHFKNLHCIRSKGSPKLLLTRYDYMYNFDAMRFESTVHFTVIDVFDKSFYNHFTAHVPDAGCFTISCCNLACLISYKTIHVCNPSTQEFVKLPDLQGRTFDPVVGFGYLAPANAYKLAILAVRGYIFDDEYGEIPYDNDMGCDIFTIPEGGPISSGYWRDIGDLPCLVEKRNGVSVDGVIYWMACEGSNDALDKKIVCLDLSNEEFGIICCPHGDLDPSSRVMGLAELKGFLGFAIYMSDISSLDIWMLKDHTSHIWVKECRIDLFPVNAYTEILGFIPLNDCNAEMLVWSLGESLLYYYNIKNEKLSAVKELNVQGPASLCLYFDSFVSLGTILRLRRSLLDA
uniref:F-box domain-containing protein n=1 Tax=Davidia involucrata TaxID=16924 RepID=A0A5B7AMX9_DAVIN